MSRINRTTFLKQSLKISALVILAPLENCLLLNKESESKTESILLNNDLLKRLVVANDNHTSQLLQTDIGSTRFSRKIGHDFAVLSASYCSKESKYYRSPLIVSALEKISKLLLSVQADDGTVNIGNLESPPDTAFLLELIAAAAHILVKDASKNLDNVNVEIKKFLLKAADALTIGGVHTPNHRWVVCAALARVHALHPNQQYINRIEEWLSEGVFIDDDGHFPERSQTYSAVEDEAFITIGRLLNKPSLFEPVRKNLELTYYYMEPGGDLVTTDSRRQDQYQVKNIIIFYLHYRYLAIRDNNSKFAAVAKFIENLKDFNKEVLSDSLFHFLENPLLQQDLPKETALPIDYEKMFTTSHLLRIRRGNTSMTLFGGVDLPLTIASGRSNSPNVFSYRKGTAILKYMRLSSNFFSMGYFYSEGLKKDGTNYLLHKKLEVPYYQPMSQTQKNPKGDYKLSPSIDGRFWNKMDFENRPVSNVKTLESSIALSESNGRAELMINVTGQEGVQVTIELCFKEGGKLSGVSADRNDNYFLEKGTGTYLFGNDSISFGPGAVSHKSIKDLEGERYSTHFGSLRTEGMHVYITGVTPFSHKLHFQ